MFQGVCFFHISEEGPTGTVPVLVCAVKQKTTVSDRNSFNADSAESRLLDSGFAAVTDIKLSALLSSQEHLTQQAQDTSPEHQPLTNTFVGQLWPTDLHTASKRPQQTKMVSSLKYAK